MTRARDIANLVDANGDIVAGALDNVPAADLVNDTTPQLGGNLDLNSNNITGTGNIDVTGTANVTYNDASRNDTLKLRNTNTGGYGTWVNFYSDYNGGYSFGKIGTENESTGGTMRFHTADTSGVSQERMRIDSIGSVTMPYQPAFIVTDNRGQGSQTANSVNISQFFTTIINNTGNGFSNTGSTKGRFTAPVSGYYHFGWNLFTTGVSSTTTTRVGINSGSTAIWSGGDRIGHANQGSVIHYMNANDYITLGSQGGVYTNYWYSANQHSRFWGYLIA